jgi:hypothetical protein
MDHHGGSGEPVAELLRPGKAGSNTAADHIVVLDTALAQVPAPLRRPDEQGSVASLRTATTNFAELDRGAEDAAGRSAAHRRSWW